MHRSLRLLIVAACNSKSAAPTNNPPGKALSSASISAAATSAAPTSKPSTPAPTAMTKDELADFQKHIKAGWALQKQEKWADAVPEFEAALKVNPTDPRALAELGWSAMNAGDFKKARTADKEAVQVAIDPIVKAQALFNLGLVQEKTGDKDGALKSFIASLALRPNKTVEQEVGKLGASPTAKAVWCAPDKKPCDCMDADPNDQDFQCQEVTKPAPPVKGWHVYRTRTTIHWFDDDYLLDERNQLVALIGETFQRPHEEDSIQVVKADGADDRRPPGPPARDVAGRGFAPRRRGSWRPGDRGGYEHELAARDDLRRR